MKQRVMFLVAGLSIGTLGLSGCQSTPERADGQSEASTETLATNSAPSDTTRGLRVGDAVPDATLATPDGREIHLRDIVGNAPIILAFYRGGWCPYCQGELTEWQAHIDEVRSMGSELIAITPESPANAMKTGNAHNLGFPILSDVHGEAALGFDLGFALDERTRTRYKGFGIDLPAINAQKDWNLVIPATYVVDTDGIIRYAYINEDYKVRADPEEVIDALESIR